MAGLEEEACKTYRIDQSQLVIDDPTWEMLKTKYVDYGAAMCCICNKPLQGQTEQDQAYKKRCAFYDAMSKKADKIRAKLAAKTKK